jgi:ankyrin repeat protein
MSERPRLELTADEQREADEYNRLMEVMLNVVRQVNGPNAPSIKDLFPGVIPVGKMEDAATSGKLWRVKQALNEGADPNEASVLCGTALHAAARQGHLEVVRLLVEQGADHKRLDGQGRTPAEAAAQCGHQHLAEYLRSLA